MLVIEDDSEIRQCLVETLELEGYSVSAAADGREGLQKARDEPVVGHYWIPWALTFGGPQ